MGTERKEKLILIMGTHEGAEAGKRDWGAEGIASIGLDRQVRAGERAQDRKPGALSGHLEH